MNVLIFSGGSGSDSLQKGLYAEYPELDITVLTNAYDNGKSTGAIRQVFDGQILGPSDVRKNQSRHYALDNGKDDVYNFIEHRFTNDNPEEYITNYYDSLDHSYKLDKLFSVVKEYFKKADKAYHISYEDFSIGNIIYGYLAAKHNNSLQRAADWMADVLEIKQETILNSDESLFLQAITKSGEILHDEADIVDYANEKDEIFDIRFLTADGEVKETSFLSQRAINAINRADMIIFSTGTQWSSLIPTYKCTTESGESFAKIIDNSKAKKFFLVNGAPDKDMYGVDGDGIIDIVRQYFDIIHGCTVVSGITDIKPSIGHIVDLDGPKYNPNKLAKELLWLFFDKPTEDATFIFDFDDTIQGRKGTYSFYSKENKKKLPNNAFIITGNDHHRVDIKDILIYADGGVNLYKDGKFIQCLDSDVKIDDLTYNNVKAFLKKYGFNMSMLHNRNDVCLNVKPIPDEFRKLFAESLKPHVPGFDVHILGTTSVDVMHPNNTKLTAIDHIIETTLPDNIYYVGDELTSGNDAIVEENKQKYGIITYEVKTPKDTFTFLKSIKG